MFCNNCGKEISDNSKFCMYCGAQLSNIKNVQDNIKTSNNKTRIALDQVNVKINKNNLRWSSISNSSKDFIKKYCKFIYALMVIATLLAAVYIGVSVHNKNQSEIELKQKQELAQANTLKHMVFVEGGSFNIGEGPISSCKNSHKVELSDYYIGIYEVTQGECGWGTYKLPAEDKGDNKPAVNISWYECISYCNSRSKEEGLEQCYLIDGGNVQILPNKNGYRLPTEAEWEYAAKGGKLSKGYHYSGSNELSEVAWYGDDQSQIHFVGKKQPNELGIYDMSGNVWEMCYDGYSQYDTEKTKNPTGDDSSLYKAMRGGASMHTEQKCSNTFRHNISPDLRYRNCGFRLVRGVKK